MPIFGSPPMQQGSGGAETSVFFRAPASIWTSSNPVLGLNEIGQETDTLKFKTGDGSTEWNSLGYTSIEGPKGSPGDDGYTPVKDVDYFDGDKGDKGDKGDQGEPGSGAVWGGITGTMSSQTDLNSVLSGKANASHSHAPAEITGTAVIANDSRLSDARTPTAHDQAISTITNLQTTLDGKETANANIQSHVTSAHSPSNAQKNSDITKAEIEAKLTGEISTHTHAGGGAGMGYTINVQALTSSPTDAQTVYFGMLPKAPTTTVNTSKIYIRKAGTLKIAEIYCYSGTAGTNEAWSLYVRKNNTTDYLIATLSVATSERVFTNSSLSIAVAAGDYIEIKGIQPTWATNPLTTIYGGYIYIE
jgi:hypothetical protein